MKLLLSIIKVLVSLLIFFSFPSVVQKKKANYTVWPLIKTDIFEIQKGTGFTSFFFSSVLYDGNEIHRLTFHKDKSLLSIRMALGLLLCFIFPLFAFEKKKWAQFILWSTKRHHLLVSNWWCHLLIWRTWSLSALVSSSNTKAKGCIDHTMQKVQYLNIPYTENNNPTWLWLDSCKIDVIVFFWLCCVRKDPSMRALVAEN